ncbi:ETC complex I subunit conserved region [Rhizoctonia solani]|uniref:ETC complex I subunit conserved region n=1 Tax=Rhizoctonia solani TaxID=456999 RepID=A0A8H7IKR0_9AGAM|nr:ETC complex I subunit conserved region [Rhizoctonia solani]
MLRFTRPLRQALKSTTGSMALPYIPILSRQGTEALVKHRLDLIEKSKGDATQVENALGEGQIEEILMSAEDELSLAGKMLEWKPWEPLEVKPAPGQWDYVRD